MQLRRAHASGNAEPSRPHGLRRKDPKSKACNGDSRHFCRHAADAVLRGITRVVAGVAAVAKSTITPFEESFSVTGGVR